MTTVGRRDFLGNTLKLGATVAAASVAGLLGDATLAGAQGSTTGTASIPDVFPVPPVTAPPPPPSPVWRFVSRPDLTPSGVSMVKSTAFDSQVAPPSYIFLAPRSAPSSSMPPGAQPGLMIIDLDGNLVWFKPMTVSSESPFNFRVQTYGSKPVLTWFQGALGPGYGVGGDYVLMDSSYSQLTTVTAKNYPSDLHEFILTPESTALLTAYEVSGSLVIGHAQEIDVANGDLVFDWPCYPAVATSESYTGTTGDYFHINSIDLWPGSARNLLVSSRNCCAMYLVERSSKQILWRLHGKRSNFKINTGAEMWYQHDGRALLDGSGVSFFDDASQPGPEHQSWGKVVTLDQTSKQAILRHQYNHQTTVIDTGSQGNCQLLPNGGHFVAFGAEPYFSQYGPSGASVLSAQLLDGRLYNGVETYRAFMFDWSATPPVSELALVVLNGAGSGNFVAFASWNGATEVASWQLSAGPSSTSLSPVAVAAKDGFETPIAITYSGAKAFRVAALNGIGQVIGTSGVVSAR